LTVPHKIRFFGTILSATAVVAIGWLDYVTGPDIGLSLLYLIPVALSGWFGGVAAAVLVGATAGTAWLIADVSWRESELAMAISVWNAFTRYVIYISEGVLLALVRRDRERWRKRVAREAALARTDHGTQLPNARAFLERVEKELQRAREDGVPVCVIYIDLDNFKAFNDRLGHAAGDAILTEVANVLLHSVRDGGVAARLGGDEFAVLLRDVHAPDAAAEGERIVAKIRAIGAMYEDLAFGATAGVACFRDAPANVVDLVRAGDDAMYVGKTQGKGRVVVQSC
jgi:diguanylate cyclase (GGDEF)-like protein